MIYYIKDRNNQFYLLLQFYALKRNSKGCLLVYIERKYFMMHKSVVFTMYLKLKDLTSY